MNNLPNTQNLDRRSEKPKTNRIAGIILSTMLIGGSPSLHSDVNMGPQVIVGGTEINVLGPGPDLQALIDGISDESTSKPYLIKLGPGEYTITPDVSTSEGLKMAPFISIKGSGQGVTVLKGAVGGSNLNFTSAAVIGANNTALTDLSVENTGGGFASVAILNSGASPRIARVAAIASGGSAINVGIYNNSSSPSIIDSTVSSTGGGFSYAIYNTGISAPIITEVTATASGGTDTNYGVGNDASSPTMTNVTATANGGNISYGVHNTSGSSPFLTNVTATGSGGTNNYGFYFDAGGAGRNPGGLNPRIEHSSLSGSTDGMVFNGVFETRIANTRITGGIDADPDGSTTQCFNVHDDGLNSVSC